MGDEIPCLKQGMFGLVKLCKMKAICIFLNASVPVEQCTYGCFSGEQG